MTTLIVQIKNKFSFIAYALVLTLSCSLIGCGGDGADKANDKNSETKSEESASLSPTKDATTSVAATDGDGAISPADTRVKLPASDAGPDVICQEFMTLLKNGNRLTAEKLLTRAAFTVTSHVDWQLPPIGSVAAQYEVGDIRFATNREKLAHVDCKVIDKIDGKTDVNQVTWMVRKKKEGWRISGMLVETAEGESKDLISFENPADVAMIKQSLQEEEESTESEGANADTQTSDKSNVDSGVAQASLK